MSQLTARAHLTSQFFANLYLDPLDHFVTDVLRAPYVRYVDDFVLFDDDPGVLAMWRKRIARFLEGRGDFLGYTLLPEGRRLPEENVTRFRNRLRGIKDRVRVGAMTTAEAHHRIAAWEAHASFAQTRTLRNAFLGLKRPDGRRKPW